MTKNPKYALFILSTILGISAISCLVALYLDTSLETSQIESIYIVTLISVTGLILIHIRILISSIEPSSYGAQNENLESGVTYIRSNQRVSKESLESSENKNSLKHFNSGTKIDSNKVLESSERELTEATLRKYTQTRDKLIDRR